MPPFVPCPPDSLRQRGSSRDSKATTRLPFTQAYLAAMRLGYTRADLATLPYGEVIYDLAAMNEEPSEEASITMATQEDIRNMLG